MIRYKNGEQRVDLRKLKVDGYSTNTNTAFEVDGFYSLGCECVKPSHTKNNEEIVAFKKLMSERRETTVKNMSIYENSVILKL